MNDRTANPAGEPNPAGESAPASGNRRRKLAIGGLLIAFVAIGVGWGAYYLTVGQYRIGTDDAYVQGHIVLITPQISGTAVEVLAEDTQFVQAGQPLVRLDPADAQVALEQAKAQLAQTVREVRVTFSNNGALAAAIQAREADVERFAADAERARADLKRANDDLKRRGALAPIGAVSGEELQHARSAVANANSALSAAQAAGAAARSALAGAREQLATNQALTDGTTVESHPNVQRAAARVREAMLAVDRVTIVAPMSGYIARKAVQVGQRVAAGAPLMAVVPLDQVWVDANFKESQLRDMRIGQPVELVADAYGSRVTYRGRITGLAAGTGAAFAILPAQNATGNWIKIVQRVPVRVAIDPEQIRSHPLRVGLSMVATVDTHDRSGAVVADGSFSAISSAAAAPAARNGHGPAPISAETASGGVPAAGTDAAADPAASRPGAVPIDATQQLIDRIISDNLGSKRSGQLVNPVAAVRLTRADPAQPAAGAAAPGPR
ncbi:MAG: HlyD family efflux transporter periplasmic adaptor subunit [Lautropia sp.]